MSNSSSIVREARPAKTPGVRLECKHFRSGAALYANGTICASLTPLGFAVKLSEQSRAAVLRKRRGKPLRYFDSGPIKKQYVVFSRATADSAWIRAFLRESIRYATRAKPPRASATRRVTNFRDRTLTVFVQEVTAALLAGRQHRTPGLGTFSVCKRRATADRCSSKMAMFRASAELRGYASGGPLPHFPGPHAKALISIVHGMRSEGGITVPLLGRMAVVAVPGKPPKLIFHDAKELNDLLAES